MFSTRWNRRGGEEGVAAGRARVVPGSLGEHASILGAATALISRELEVLVSSAVVA